MPPKNLNLQPKQQPVGVNLTGQEQKALPPGTKDALFQRQEAIAQAIAAQTPPVELDLPDDMLGSDGKFLDADLAFGGIEQKPPIPAAPPVDPNGGVIESERDGKIIQPNTPPVKAPSTIHEYRQQHMPLEQSRFPEVTDIFQGKVPGQVPLNGPIVSKPTFIEPQAPQPPVEVVVKHELPQEEMAYIFVRDYGAYAGDGVYQQWYRGDIVFDTYMIDLLLQGGCDAIQPHSVANDFVTCPACSHAFPPSAAKSLQARYR